MENYVFAYCFKCAKVYKSEDPDTSKCPYCGASTADDGAAWKTIRQFKKHRHLPEIPIEGVEYDLFAPGKLEISI